MKRTLALLLTLLMVATMIPASLINVLARGPGVAANTIENGTHEAAPDQYIPETVVVDGILNDSAWHRDDWTEVSAETGKWNSVPTADVNQGTTYYYQLEKDYYFLYGAFTVDSAVAKSFTIWLNDGSATNGYTDKFVFDLTQTPAEDKTINVVRETVDGEEIVSKSPYAHQKFAAMMVKDGTNITVEFKSLLADFCANAKPNLTFFVSLECEQSQSLFHPNIAINEGFDRNDYLPSSTYWPESGAGTITTDDFLGNGDHSYWGELKIDGEFHEAYWAEHTSFYDSWYERMNMVEYRDQDDTPYSDITYNRTPYASYAGATHDLRVTASYIHLGSMLYNTYSSAYAIGISAYDIHDASTGTYDQLYIKITSGGTITAYFYANANGTFTTTDVSAYVKGGVIATGNYCLYTQELQFDRTGAPNFIPDCYDFAIDNSNSGTPRWAIDSDFSATYAPNYDSALDSSYYVPKYYRNDSNEYYNPYTTYNPDGYLGEKTWPGGQATASSWLNCDWVSSGSGGTRINDVYYMHTMVSDYEDLLGAVHITCENEGEGAFTQWKYGEATKPGAGDYFSVYVKSAIGTDQSVYRYDMWAYKEDGAETATAVMGRYVSDGVYDLFSSDPNSGLFVEIDKYVTNVWAFEYGIPHTLTGTIVDYDESVADYATSVESPLIYQYYTAFNIANSDESVGGHASMMWPMNGSSTLPSGRDTWSKPANVRYENVIRAIEPDGKLLEDYRVNLLPLSYNNSSYRKPSNGQNILGVYGMLQTGNEYAYLAGRMDGALVKNSTKVTLWLKNTAGEIHYYDFYVDANGYNTMAYDGTVQHISRHHYAFTTANGSTNFEMVILMSQFGGLDGGFEYFIEFQNTINGEVIQRITPKANFPEVVGRADYFDMVVAEGDTTNEWTNAGTVQDLVYFFPESIEIDGELNDSGWDSSKWIWVSPEDNANLQNTQLVDSLYKNEYYYQIRFDNHNMYVAAVMTYYKTDLTTDNITYDTIAAQYPNFRMWIKNGQNGSNTDPNASNTFSTYFSISIENEAGVDHQSLINLFKSYPNNTRPLYDANYNRVVPLMNDDGTYQKDPVTGEILFRRAEGDESTPTTVDRDFSQSEFDGHTQYVINEQEGQIVDPTTGQTKGECINPEDYEKEGMLKEKREGIEEGRMVSASGKKFKLGNEEITLADNQLIVEFKVGLDEFGGRENFQHIITTGCHAPAWGGAQSTVYPPVPSEVDSGSNYFHYYYPFWKWNDAFSMTMTTALRTSWTLRTYERPVITLGAKVNQKYDYVDDNGVLHENVNAIRLGGLWTEKYIREVDGLRETNGYAANGNYTDYWDVQSMGLVVLPTHMTQYNTNQDAKHPGAYDLFVDTPNAAVLDADGIVSWSGKDPNVDPKNNFADYENFAFYVTVVNAPPSMNFCFRGFVTYYDDVNASAPYYDVVLERSINMVVDKAIGGTEGWYEDSALPDATLGDGEQGSTGAWGGDKLPGQGGTGDDEDIPTVPAANENTIAYIPLDNRAVNVDRAQYLAAAAGYDLRIPDEADYITTMDGNVLAGDAASSHGGNPKNLLKWLKAQEKAGVTRYAIALDQVFSGGLANSRNMYAMTPTTTEGYEYLEYEIADYLIYLAKNYTVAFGDTIMRLCPETEYQNYTVSQYNKLRNWGKIPRYDILANNGELTVENVIASYTQDENGNPLSLTYTYAGYDDNGLWNNNITVTVEQSQVDSHVAARARKLRLADYVIDNAEGIEHIFFAVDDSDQDGSIQTNDIAYIDENAKAKGLNYQLFGGADELGMLCIAALASAEYQPNGIKGNVVYYGDGKDMYADNYDYMSLDSSITKHLAALGVKNPTFGATASKDTVQVLVLTRHASADATAIKTQAEALVAQLRSNIAAGIPTIVIDASNDWGGNTGILSDALINSWNASHFDIAQTLAISKWNTVGNAIGVGLSNGIGRYAYILGNDTVTDESNIGFIKGMTTALVKDIAYLQHKDAGVTGYQNFNFTQTGAYAHDDAESILAMLNASNTILGANLAEVEFGSVSVSNVSWPWRRDFECRFDVNVSDTSVTPDTPTSFTTDIRNPNWSLFGNDYTNYVLTASGSATVGNQTVLGNGGAADWNKVLLEYDSESGKYKVLEVNSASYENWTYGNGKVVLFAKYSDEAAFLSSLSAGDWLAVTSGSFSNTSDAVENVSVTFAKTTAPGVVDPEPTTSTFTTTHRNPNWSVNSSDGHAHYVITASDYTAVADQTILGQYATNWSKVLLEYDNNSDNYKVIALNDSNFTEWDYGIDRIALFASDAEGVSFIDGLQVGQRVKLTSGSFDRTSDTAEELVVTFTALEYQDESAIVKPTVTNPTLVTAAPNNITVAYVPLDDRPVHVDRVQYLAQASGMTLSMPAESDYATVLGTSGHGGNTANILAWLKSQETQGVDYYVIALDQVFSGGLVNSRYSDSTYSDALVEHDLEAVEFLTELAKNNYVVFTDTVMRLASTSGYKEHTDALYKALRAYGEQERKVLSSSDLTISNVISTYRYGTDGISAISRTNGGYTASETQVAGYLKARERKLRIIDHLIKNAGANINALMVGVDDSAEGVTIQTNEVAYIEKLIGDYGVTGTVFAGADEMGVMGIANIASNIFPTAANKGKVPVNVKYYGPAADSQADKYDKGTLSESIDLHLKSIGAYQVDEAYANDATVLQILVLTRAQTSVESTGDATTYANQLAAQLVTNLNNNVPTVVIDASNHYGGAANYAFKAMVNAGIFNRTDATELLGYSEWNTVGNAVGLALGNAIARYAYIYNAAEITTASNEGFIESLGFSFIKDTAYKAAESLTWNYNTKGNYSANEILAYLNKQTNILGNGESLRFNINVSLGSVTWPWGRPFEARIPVVATVGDASAEPVWVTTDTFEVDRNNSVNWTANNGVYDSVMITSSDGSAITCQGWYKAVLYYNSTTGLYEVLAIDLGTTSFSSLYWTVGGNYVTILAHSTDTEMYDFIKNLSTTDTIRLANGLTHSDIQGMSNGAVSVTFEKGSYQE